MKVLWLMVLMAAGIVSQAGTVAHYKFERTAPNAPLYEMTDSSGRGHHGAVVGQELFELSPDVPPYAGVTGEALDLRGRLDYAVIPHHADFAPSGDWTIEFFIKVDLFHQDHGGVTNVAKGAFMPIVNTNLAYTIMAKPNTNGVRFDSAWGFHYVPAIGWVVFTVSYGGERGDVFLASGDLRDGKWHHIAVVFAATREYELRLFQDGFGNQSSNIGNTPFSWGDGPIMVGAWARQSASFDVDDRNFDGFLDEIRFSDTALNTESFVVNFGPLLFPPIAAEAYAAFELTFEGEAGKIYRIEQIDAETGEWERIGYAEGARGSFFHRRDFFAPPIYRVVLNEPGELETVASSKFEAIELRFPTDAGQLYLITQCETLNCVDGEQIFLLGDGAKMSYFERTVPNQSRFYKIERY